MSRWDVKQYNYQSQHSHIIIDADDVFPTLNCPTSYSLYIDSNQAASRFVFPETGKAASVMDNIDQNLQPTYVPSELTVGAGDVGNTYTISVEVVDSSNNRVSCKYMVDIKAAPCQDWDLMTPIGGQKSCVRNAQDNGFACTASCPSGKYFYFNPTESTLDYSCTDGSSFAPSGLVPGCVGEC